MRPKSFVALFLLMLCASVFFSRPVRALDREAVRSLFSDLSAAPEVFEREPLLSAPYEAGTLSDEAVSVLTARFNALRALAGLGPVSADPDLCDLSQHGAVLMAVLGGVTHTPAQPEGMPDLFFERAELAARSCNLAQFNWFSPRVPGEALVRFLRDDTTGNLTVLGHRRWMLYPYMGLCGFGVAADVLGQSYVALYVMDNSATEAGADYDLIAWPCEGAFPAEFMMSETPWSISPNPTIYDLDASCPRLKLEELGSGAQWDFDEAGVDPEDGAYFLISNGRYGDGPAFIFRPDLSDVPELENGYEQNQVWRVTLEGMVDLSGAQLDPIVYLCEMISLSPIDPASVELSPRALEMKAGEERRVSATVYPRWADDLSYSLTVSDSAVAQVDEEGVIRALSPGECLVIARTANGRTDEVPLVVMP